MQVIRYLFGSVEVRLPYTEANIEIAKSEAVGGEYTIEDDGQPDPVEPAPTLETRVGNLETDSNEMKEALELLISGVAE